VSFRNNNKYFIRCSVVVVLVASWVGWKMIFTEMAARKRDLVQRFLT